MSVRALRFLVVIMLVGGAFANAVGRPMKNTTAKSAAVNIIPQPVQYAAGSGVFTLDRRTFLAVVSGPPEVPFAAAYLSGRLRLATGYPVPLRMNVPLPRMNVIVFEYVAGNTLGMEEYTLEVKHDKVHIRASSDAGHWYAVQTLLQLLPPAVFRTKTQPDVRWTIPCLTIHDGPRFSWRGMHLDVSRHFFPKEFIRTFIDLLAMHKMNTFHWHLTDDQGWRIEIKKYPRLTSVGAWRADRGDTHWDLCEPQRPGEPATYGGFYTQDDIRELVQYAQQRNVTIVPEIEMPAHTTAALAAYPEYSCTGGPFSVTTGALWPITDIFCAGNDSTFMFLQDVLSEVMDLFPGQYIHIGGDEADKTNWKTCPKCQARMKQEGLADEHALQSYFIKRIEKFVVSKNRRLIGWDEILEGGLAPQATVMSWRGMEGGLAAARLGHDVVMTPGSHCYFNSYQGKPEFEPLAGGGYLPLRKVYSFEPVSDSLSEKEAGHILGGQACLWTEFVADPRHAEYMMLPRLAAMAEVLWSPKKRRDEKSFFSRVDTQLRRYEAGGYNVAKSLYMVSMTSVLDVAKKQVLVSLANESGNTPIRYTIDGSTPTATSPLYKGPFAAKKTLEVQAVSVRNGKLLGPPTKHRIRVHKAVACRVAVKVPFQKYTGGGDFALTNGILGTRAYDDGNWQGYEQSDLDATIDLGAIVSVSNVTAHFLQDHHAWIFGPKAVQFEISEDGKTFMSIGRFDMPVPTAAQEVKILEFAQPVTSAKVRYIRVFAHNTGICPDWHIGKGGKAWLFVDEIVVE